MLQADRQTQLAFGEDPSMELELDSILFKRDTMYQHNIMRVNYTTYNVRRGQDIINPNTDHRDIMLLAPTNGSEPASKATSRKFDSLGPEPPSKCEHQYQYARVLGIYHVNVIYSGVVLGKQNFKPHRMEFLFVRWFDCPQTPVQSGWSNIQLDMLLLRKSDQDDAFGFVDPDRVLRACHIIPQFSLGRRQLGMGLSKYAGDHKDWRKYYANRLVSS